jgi:hypothetical protein
MLVATPNDTSFYKYFDMREPCCFLSSNLTSCAVDDRDIRRLCCCGGPCPLDYTPKWIEAGVSVEVPLAHWTFDGYAPIYFS